MNTLISLSPAARMGVVFEALGRDDMDALIANWAEDGIYFNPTLGPPTEGKQNVYDTIDVLSKRLKERGEKLIIDRSTEVLDESPTRAYIEWHVEGGAKPGRLGVHVVSFNEDGLLHRVNVFSHA